MLWILLQQWKAQKIQVLWLLQIMVHPDIKQEAQLELQDFDGITRLINLLVLKNKLCDYKWLWRKVNRSFFYWHLREKNYEEAAQDWILSVSELTRFWDLRIEITSSFHPVSSVIHVRINHLDSMFSHEDIITETVLSTKVIEKGNISPPTDWRHNN